MKGKRIIILMAVVAAIVTPSALGDSGKELTIPGWLSQLQQPGGTFDLAGYESFRGGPAGVYEGAKRITIPSWLSQLRQPGGISGLANFENFRGGPGAGGPVFPSDFLGHDLAGPGVAGSAIGVETETPVVARFDWADAAVGAGFEAGIALLVAAGVLTIRRRRSLAHT